MTITRTPPRFCPVCFNILDSITGLETENPPEPGDFSICLKCGAVLRVMMATDGLDYALSSLMEIPVNSRLGFAQGGAGH
jgi:hypothetical protein